MPNRRNAYRLSIGPGDFYRQALVIAIPVMLQSFLTGLVSLVDNFMVAGLGDVKMAAVNAVNQINFVFLIVLNTVCIAGGIYLSQHRGAHDAEGMRQAFRFKILASLFLTTLYSALCLAFPERIIGLMVGGNTAGPEIIASGSEYLRSVVPSFAPMAVAMACGSSYRDIGETRASLIVSTMAALANTFLNWVFIYGNLGAPRLEVRGAAYATDFARLLEAVLFLLWTRRRKPDFAFPIHTLFRIDPALIGAVLVRSGMMLFSETAWVLSETVITAMYNAKGGAETVAGMAAAWTMANLFFLVFNAIHTTTAVTVGTALGAGRLEEAERRGSWISAGAIGFGAFVALLAASSSLVVPIVFSNLSVDARATTRAMILVIAAYLPLWSLLNSQFALSRAGGDTAMGMWVDVGVTYAVFLPVAWLISSSTPAGPVALFGLAKLTDLPKAGVAAWWLSKGRWVRNLTSLRSGGRETPGSDGR